MTETGEVIFPAAPAAGTLAALYRGTKFNDTQIKDALSDGLQLLWPEVYDPNFDSASIVLSPTALEYTLPALFGDSRVVIREIEYAPPGGITKFIRTGAWRMVEDGASPRLIFERFFPPGSQCRISYAQPFDSLSQVPTEAAFLPVYYAVSRLLMDQEVIRLRADDLQALTGEGAAQPGLNSSTADYWFGRFTQGLEKLSLDLPARRTVAGRAADRLNLSSFWRRAS